MKPTFAIGDHVYIAENIGHNGWYYTEGSVHSINANGDMRRYAGKKATVIGMHGKDDAFYKLDIDGGKWLWAVTMFESWTVTCMYELSPVTELLNGVII